MLKVIAAAALAAVGLAAGASAKGDPVFALVRTPVEHVRVSYADLDLSRPAGAQVMLLRIKSAADEACGVGMRHISLEESVSVRACVHDAVTRAVSNRW
jgi:UrcA family protein